MVSEVECSAVDFSGWDGDGWVFCGEEVGVMVVNGLDMMRKKTVGDY
jgi:hypothetical protein